MPQYDFRSPRLFVEPSLAPEAEIEASPEQANYLGNVLRLEAGAGVLVFNGRDGEWTARLARPAKKRLVLVVAERRREQAPAGDLHYLFAPLKAGRFDYMIQKAVEMGAGVLQPVLTQHVQAPKVNLARMRANAIEAAEQCGILAVPDCREPVKLATLLAGFDGGRTLIFCDEAAEVADPVAALRPLAGRPLALLIGPEGGFSAAERQMLTAEPFTRTIALGPRILRADTAAVAALAVVQAAAGDWRSG